MRASKKQKPYRTPCQTQEKPSTRPKPRASVEPTPKTTSQTRSNPVKPGPPPALGPRWRRLGKRRRKTKKNKKNKKKHGNAKTETTKTRYVTSGGPVQCEGVKGRKKETKKETTKPGTSPPVALSSAKALKGHSLMRRNSICIPAPDRKQEKKRKPPRKKTNKQTNKQTRRSLRFVKARTRTHTHTHTLAHR